MVASIPRSQLLWPAHKKMRTFATLIYTLISWGLQCSCKCRQYKVHLRAWWVFHMLPYWVYGVCKYSWSFWWTAKRNLSDWHLEHDDWWCLPQMIPVLIPVVELTDLLSFIVLFKVHIPKYVYTYARVRIRCTHGYRAYIHIEYSCHTNVLADMPWITATCSPVYCWGCP